MKVSKNAQTGGVETTVITLSKIQLKIIGSGFA